MNVNSHICNFISNHEDWELLLTKEYNLRIKRDGDLVIFNYFIDCDFFDEIVQEARGIIIDVKNLEVVCWPFRKFGNFSEAYADKIDWKSARVLEKVDGSIVKLWFNHATQNWQFSTNKTINATFATVEEHPGLTYLSVIKTSENYGDIPFEKLNKDNTYIFELISPETQVVIDYGVTKLYHIGTRNNKTGIECEEDIGIIKPEEYSVSTLQECIDLVAKLNDGASEILKEGFVVVDKNYNRIKVKSIEYIARHHVDTGFAPSKTNCVSLILKGGNLQPLFGKNNKFEHIVKYYEYKFSELLYCAERIGVLAKNLYEEYGHDRRPVANEIKKYPLSFVGFRCLDSGLSGREIILALPLSRICDLIPSYELDEMKIGNKE